MIWIILVFGLILRLINLNQSLWLDEAINIVAAKSFSLSALITQYARADFHPPGWFIILWFWGKLFGYSEVVMRLPSVFFGVLTIYVTYLIGKKLISRNLGLVAALLISINPLHIYYSQEARMYSLACLAVAANILFLIKMVKRERVNFAFFIFSNILVLASDYVAYFIFPAEFIFLILFKKGEFIKKWSIALATSLILFSWWIPVFLSQLDVGAAALTNLPVWKFIQGTFSFKTLPLTFVKFIIGRISLANKILYYVLLIPICSLFFYLLWISLKKLDNLQKKLLISWVVVPPLVATVVSLVMPVYDYFRVLFVLPGFVILIAVGILYFNGRLRISLFTTVVLIEIVCALLYLFTPGYQREDWRGLVNYFQNITPSIVLFESSGTLPPFEYYAKGSLNAKGALKDFPAKNENAISDLESILKNHKDIYLVDYLVQISDPNRLVARKLTSLGYKEADIKNFNGVGFVYHYIKK